MPRQRDRGSPQPYDGGLVPGEQSQRTVGEQRAARVEKKVHPDIKAVLDRVGHAKKATRMRAWIYRDAAGRDYMATTRFDLPDGSKDYLPYHRVEGGWTAGDPAGRLPLYRLPTLPGATRVYFTEGEKSADLIVSLGLVSSTTSHGAGSPQKTDLSPLAAKEVVILPDHDDEGEGYAAHVVRLLAALDPKPVVKIVRLPVEGKGDDIEQWLEGASEGWEPEQCRGVLEMIADEVSPIDLDAVEKSPDPEPKPDGHRPSSNGHDDDDPEFNDALSKCQPTDMGNGERLVARHGDDIRYCHPWKKWLAWDGMRWSLDNTAIVSSYAKDTARKLLG